MTNNPPKLIRYLCVDHTGNNIGEVDSLTFSESFICQLCEAIAEKHSLAPAGEACYLTIWTIRDKGVAKLPSSQLANRVENFTFSEDSQEIEEHDIKETVEELGLEPEETILVYVPEILQEIQARYYVEKFPALQRRNEMLSTVKQESKSVDTAEGVERAHKLLFTGQEPGQFGQPVAICHPSLAKLQHRMETLDLQVKDTSKPLDQGVLMASKQFFESASCFYELEAQYRHSIKTYFDAIFQATDATYVGMTGYGTSWRQNKVYTTWGDYAICEVISIFGLRGDASLKASVRYARHCASLKEKYKSSKMPCILIGAMGNVLEISIAVCLEEIIIDNILHLKIREGLRSNETVTKLTLIASALRECAGELREEYRLLQNPTPQFSKVKSETWHLPCPSVIPSSNTPIPRLEFTTRLGRDNEELKKLTRHPLEMRSLFLAKYGPPESSIETVVKFTAAYNADAHMRLAEQNCAPKLYACVPVIGGVQMIVMERVKGKRMFDGRPHSLPVSVFEDLKKAIKILHDEDNVFGDLRDTNVMISRKNGSLGAMLVDFDWTAKEQAAWYPLDINNNLVGDQFAPDIVARGPILKKHDQWALAYLIDEYCRDKKYREAESSALKRAEGYIT